VEELTDLQTKSYDDVKKVLLEKDWIIIQEAGGKKFPFGDIRFAYDDETQDRQNSFFISFHYDKKDSRKNNVQFEFPNHEKYLKYVENLGQLGFKKINQDKDVNQFWQIYQNAKFYIEAVIRPVENYFGKQKIFYEWIISNKDVPYTGRRK
jgi:hypothetical protein